MTIQFGVHTGPSNTTVAELQHMWRYVEERPFDWISIWDHLYSADTISPHNFDAVAIHTALAMSTTRVRCGSLVYCAAYPHPAVLAKAMATIDHLSNGRCEFGIGAGWAKFEFNAYGIPYQHRRVRLDATKFGQGIGCPPSCFGFTVSENEIKHFKYTNAAHSGRHRQLDRTPLFFAIQFAEQFQIVSQPAE